MKRLLAISVALAACALAAPSDLAAQRPVRALEDLVGARSRAGERQVESRGYELVRRETTADSSYTFWREPRTGRCVSIRTDRRRYAEIVYTSRSDCREARSQPWSSVPAEPPPAAPGEDSFETVCGVETGGGSHRYRCHLRNENCNRGGGPCRTRLYLPDEVLVVTWHSDGSADVQAEGVIAERCRVDEQQGQTRFHCGGDVWFVYRSPDWAARELAKLR